MSTTTTPDQDIAAVEDLTLNLEDEVPCTVDEEGDGNAATYRITVRLNPCGHRKTFFACDGHVAEFRQCLPWLRRFTRVTGWLRLSSCATCSARVTSLSGNVQPLS